MEYEVGKMFGITGDVAIVTGASGGIGEEVALAMASLGAKVALVDINVTKINDNVSKLKGNGFEVLGIQTDVTNKESVKAMVEQVKKNFGSIDILINCAGVAYLDDAIDFDEQKWDWVIDVNLKGTLLTCQAVGKHMLQQKKGRVVNFSSVRGLQGRPKLSAYATSKGAVNLLTKSLAVEWAKDNVNVNAIAPTFTLTDINRDVLNDKQAYEGVISRIPKRKLCEPQWIVGPVVFLCSPCAEFITGHILYVDGGWTAG